MYQMWSEFLVYICRIKNIGPHHKHTCVNEPNRPYVADQRACTS